jgi:DMSO/TMAO reductase YedYZ molybdopterin-dependent catalytic subunit
MGDFITYDPKTMKEVPHGELKLVLMYELEGKPLSQDGGKPLRLAIIGKDGLLTEGNMWLKWVNRIEVMKVSQLQ